MPLPTIMEYSDKMSSLEAGTSSDADDLDNPYDVSANYYPAPIPPSVILRPWKIAAYSSIALNVLLILALVGYYYHAPNFPLDQPMSTSSLSLSSSPAPPADTGAEFYTTSLPTSSSDLEWSRPGQGERIKRNPRYRPLAFEAAVAEHRPLDLPPRTPVAGEEATAAKKPTVLRRMSDLEYALRIRGVDVMQHRVLRALVKAIPYI